MTQRKERYTEGNAISVNTWKGRRYKGVMGIYLPTKAKIH